MLLEIGKLTKTQGLKGEIRLKLYSNEYDVLDELDYLIVDGENVEFKKTQQRAGFAVVLLRDIKDINSVLKYVGKSVFVEKDNVYKNQDELLVNDIIGLIVKNTNGVIMGKITDVKSFGAGDVYYMKNLQNKEILFPNARGVVIDIDFDNQYITIDENIFAEISVEN